MELTKDINFNLDNFEKGKDFTLNYSGKLLENGSNDIYINFGYGENWNNKGELKMYQTSNGFSVNLIPQNSGELNFCFRNENNIWDNNSYNNYTINIGEAAPVVETEVEKVEEIKEVEIQLDNNQPVIEPTKIDTPIYTEPLNNVTEKNIAEINTVIEAEPKVEEDNLPVENFEEKAEVDEMATERKTFNIDAIIEEILNTEISPAPVQEFVPEQHEEPKQEKIVANENPTHVTKTSLLVEDVLVPFYTNESAEENNNQFLPVDTTTYSKFFTIRRKIKLVLYRILNTIPKLLTGNYTKKKNVGN